VSTYQPGALKPRRSECQLGSLFSYVRAPAHREHCFRSNLNRPFRASAIVNAWKGGPGGPHPPLPGTDGLAQCVYWIRVRAARPGGGVIATERLGMRKTREILRQKWELGLSHRIVARSLGVGVGVGTVSEVVTRAVVAGLASWTLVQGLDDGRARSVCTGGRRGAQRSGRCQTAAGSTRSCAVRE
jgi:hypothetical protein